MMNEEQHQQIHQSGFMIAQGVEGLVGLMETLPEDDPDVKEITTAAMMIGMALERLSKVVDRHHETWEAEAEAEAQPKPIEGEDAEAIMAEFNDGVDDFLAKLTSGEG